MLARTLFFLEAVSLLLPAVQCHWSVEVQLYRFVNLYNAEIHENGQFCCCDSSICETDLSDLPNNCSARCDTAFNIAIAPCTNVGNASCLIESTTLGSIVDSPSVIEYGYFFHFRSGVTPNNLSINMVEMGGPGTDLRRIDRFIVTLSPSEAAPISTYAGENNISVIDLSYHLFCENTDDCPNVTTLPQESCTTSVSTSLVIVTATTTFYELQLATPGPSIFQTVECSTEAQLPLSHQYERYILIVVASISLILATVAVTILTCILCCKKVFKSVGKMDSNFGYKEGGLDNPVYDPQQLGDEFSTIRRISEGTGEPYTELNNALYDSRPISGKEVQQQEHCYDTPDQISLTQPQADSDESMHM